VFVSTEYALDMHKLALNSLQAFYEGFERERERERNRNIGLQSNF